MKEARDLVAYIVTNITGDPDCFKIESSIDENGVLLVATVDRAQAGRILGKQGATVDAIRNLLRALGMKNNHRYHLKVVIDE